MTLAEIGKAAILLARMILTRAWELVVKAKAERLALKIRRRTVARKMAERFMVLVLHAILTHAVPQPEHVAFTGPASFIARVSVLFQTDIISETERIVTLTLVQI